MKFVFCFRDFIFVTSFLAPVTWEDGYVTISSDFDAGCEIDFEEIPTLITVIESQMILIRATQRLI